jgi:hypothetical protein
LDVKAHAASVVETNNSISSSGDGDGLGGGFYYLRLGRCERAKGKEQSLVDGTSVVQDFLKSDEACWRWCSGVVFRRLHLNQCTISQCYLGV